MEIDIRKFMIGLSELKFLLFAEFLAVVSQRCCQRNSNKAK